MVREELPGPVACQTIGTGDKERPLVYNSTTNRATRRAHGRYNRDRQRIPGVAIAREHQPWKGQN